MVRFRVRGNVPLNRTEPNRGIPKQKRCRQRQDLESGDDNAVNEILLQRRAARTQQITRSSASGSVLPLPLPGQLGRLDPDRGIKAPLPPLPVHQVMCNRHINPRSATQTIPPPPPPVQQEGQSQQVHGRLATRAVSPPPSPVQQAGQPLGVTQPNTQAHGDLDDAQAGAPLSPSASSRRLPPKFVARSRIVVDSPRSDRQPSPPSDLESENEDRRRC